MSSKKNCGCPHAASVSVNNINTWDAINQKCQVQGTCQTCGTSGPDLRICLHPYCLHIGCGNEHHNHSRTHAIGSRHQLSLHLTTAKIFCYVCEVEVNKEIVVPHPEMDSHSSSSTATTPLRSPVRTTSPHDNQDESSDEEDQKPRGLTGLRNLGNTCYMNAAIQALSNCPPLTRFFLECGCYVPPKKKLGLSRAYLKLMHDMWDKRRLGYVVPSTIAHEIKRAHPMFRGATQQDTQEFLRCFMDQLHEELKIPKYPAAVDACRMKIDPCEEAATMDNGDTTSDYENSDVASEDISLEDKGRCPARTDSGFSSGSGEKMAESVCEAHADVVNSKYYKESTNQHIAEECSEVCVNGDIEAQEFSDAASELEPLQGRHDVKPWRRPQAECSDGATLRSRHTSDGSARSASPPNVQVHPPGTSPGKRKKPEYSSVISDIFDGRLLSSVQCLTCERISSRRETFQDLSLPIPSKDHLQVIHATHAPSGKAGTCADVTLHQGWLAWMFAWLKSPWSWFWGPGISLQDCLSAFFSADELKGDNMYSCEKCKKLRNGVKYSKVMQLPEVLCIHLKRFRHDFLFSSKLSNFVTFPLKGLDLSPYTHRDCTDTVAIYDLVAVICHHGTAGGGHYTAYSLNAHNDLWYEFDDQYVTQVDATTVENCEAYVLFYQKRDEEMVAFRQKVIEVISNTEESMMKFWVSKSWLNKFNTFAEPGPISNSDFLCRHGGVVVAPEKIACVKDLAMEVPAPVWEILLSQFGGGPAVNHLYECKSCLQESEALLQRQNCEYEAFVQLHKAFQREKSPSAIYAMSMAWFTTWEAFVNGKTDEPPGPIDNSKISLMKGGVATVRSSSSYVQLSAQMWQCLYDIYGGGPQVVLKQAPTLSQIASQHEPESKPVVTEPVHVTQDHDYPACDGSNQKVKPRAHVHKSQESKIGGDGGVPVALSIAEEPVVPDKSRIVEQTPVVPCHTKSLDNVAVSPEASVSTELKLEAQAASESKSSREVVEANMQSRQQNRSPVGSRSNAVSRPKSDTSVKETSGNTRLVHRSPGETKSNTISRPRLDTPTQYRAAVCERPDTPREYADTSDNVRSSSAGDTEAGTHNGGPDCADHMGAGDDC